MSVCAGESTQYTYYMPCCRHRTPNCGQLLYCCELYCCTAHCTAVLQVAVLDEIQMMGDAGRGWAWTQALLGLPARSLHVCGDPAALHVLRALVEECGDELEVGQ